jgi:hypothetical protein
LQHPLHLQPICSRVMTSVSPQTDRQPVTVVMPYVIQFVCLRVLHPSPSTSRNSLANPNLHLLRLAVNTASFNKQTCCCVVQPLASRALQNLESVDLGQAVLC